MKLRLAFIITCSISMACTLASIPAGAQTSQRQNQQNARNGSGNTQNLNLQPNLMASPLPRNPEELTPVLPLGPLPRSNGSPALIYQYVNQQISQLMIQLTNQYINMSETMAGGNGPPGAACGIGTSLNCTNQQPGKNSRGLAPKTQAQQQQQGSGAHSNPAQGQGQTP